MNVTVENLAPCKKLLRVDVDAQTVDATFEKVTKEFLGQARVPGFRPGKVPRETILKLYGKQIEGQAKEEIIKKSFHDAIKGQNLRVVHYSDVEEIQFGKGQNMLYTSTLETAPEFELPEYKGIVVKVPSAVVTIHDEENAMKALREQKSKFEDPKRPSEKDDYLVINYKGTCEGKPITDFVPTAAGLAAKQNFWISLGEKSFLPGFGEQLLGVSAGDRRTVKVELPVESEEKALAGKQLEFDVEVVNVQVRILPEINDDFAKSFGAENLEKLKEGIRTDLEREIKYKQNQAIRNEILRNLDERVQFELPNSVVEAQTRNNVYEIVGENQRRGVDNDTIDQHKGEIFNHAAGTAKNKVKTSFILGRIAEKENIGATDEDLTRYILATANHYKMKPEKLVKQIQSEGSVNEIRNQIIMSKVIDWLQLNAKIEETAVSAAS